MIRFFQQRKLTVILCILLSVSFIAVSFISYSASNRIAHSTLVDKELPLTANAIYAELKKDVMRPFFIASTMAHNRFLYDWVANGEKVPAIIANYLTEINTAYQLNTSFFISSVALLHKSNLS